jgi:fructose-1,6-bisphosphatase I
MCSACSIFFDPLDGSSNIDTGAPLGTIFSIYHTSALIKGREPILPQGSAQIAAGYILYGSTTLLVYATAEGVEGFTLDPATGCFLHSHPHITISTHPKIYIANEANEPLWEDDTRTYVQRLKTTSTIKHRNIGCLVADFHTILISGGVFLYPADRKNKNGKLRLMYEVNPMAYITRAAGGCADSHGVNPLSITPATLHQKVPIVFECSASGSQT